MTMIRQCDRCGTRIEFNARHLAVTVNPQNHGGVTAVNELHVCDSCRPGFLAYLAGDDGMTRMAESAGVTVRRGMFENGPAA